VGEDRDRSAAISPDDQLGAVLMNAAIIPLHIPRIVREPDAPGWLVVYRSFGWAFGSRRDALLAARELTNEVRP
jgi:hypothetical protein